MWHGAPLSGDWGSMPVTIGMVPCMLVPCDPPSHDATATMVIQMPLSSPQAECVAQLSPTIALLVQVLCKIYILNPH